MSALRHHWLITRLLLRAWIEHPLRQLLTALAVSLGVALLIATETNSRTILAAVSDVERTLQSAFDRVVTRPGGVLDSEIVALRSDSAFESVSGTVTLSARLPDSSDLTLVGVSADALTPDARKRFRLLDLSPAVLFGSQPAIVVARHLLDATGRRVGDSMEIDCSLGRVSFRIAGALEADPPLDRALAAYAFVSLDTAQRISARPGIVDRVELRLRGGVSQERVEASIRSVLGDGAVVRNAADSAIDSARSIRVFRAMFFLNGLLALVIAAFFVFNSVSASIAERTSDAALWRSLGMSRSQLLALLLADAGLLASGGGVLGLFLGALLARATQSLVVGVIQNVHFEVPPLSPGAIDLDLAIGAVVLAVGFSVLAALAAALDLVRRAPLEIGRELALAADRERRLARMAALGLAFVVVTIGVATWLPRGHELVLGGLFTVVLPLGLAWIAPFCVLFVCRLLRPLAYRASNPALFLAIDSLRARPTRTAFTVAAFALALALVIGHSAIAKGMTRSLREWLEGAIPSEIVIAGHPEFAMSTFQFREESLLPLREIPGVEHLFRIRIHRLMVDGLECAVSAQDLEITRLRSHHTFVAGERERAFDEVIAGRGVIVSENFSWRTGKQVGDGLRLVGPEGPIDLTIVGVVLDFHHPNGTLLLHLANYRAWFHDPLVDFVELCLAPGIRESALHDTLERVRAALPREYPFLGVFPKERVIRSALSILDDLEALSWMQLVLAVAIGAAALLATTTLSILGRVREIALLAALGMDPNLRRRSLILEVLLLAAGSGIAGVVLGNLLFLPANLVFRHFAGFAFQHAIPWGATVLALVLALLTALLAAQLPLRRLGRIDLRSALDAS